MPWAPGLTLADLPSLTPALPGVTKLGDADAAFEGHLQYEETDGVAVITYDRPERRNALSVGMYKALVAAVEKANASEAVGAIVLTHTGPVFCAGIDLKAPPEPKDPLTGIRETVAVLGMADDTSWIHLLRRSKPTVAALNGAAVGLGATHILAADLRIGSPAASFSFPFLARGTMPEFGCSALLPRIVGFAAAMEICLTCANLDAQQSLARPAQPRDGGGRCARRGDRAGRATGQGAAAAGPPDPRDAARQRRRGGLEQGPHPRAGRFRDHVPGHAGGREGGGRLDPYEGFP